MLGAKFFTASVDRSPAAAMQLIAEARSHSGAFDALR